MSHTGVSINNAKIKVPLLFQGCVVLAGCSRVLPFLPAVAYVACEAATEKTRETLNRLH